MCVFEAYISHEQTCGGLRLWLNGNRWSPTADDEQPCLFQVEPLPSSATFVINQVLKTKNRLKLVYHTQNMVVIDADRPL